MDKKNIKKTNIKKEKKKLKNRKRNTGRKVYHLNYVPFEIIRNVYIGFGYGFVYIFISDISFQ